MLLKLDELDQCCEFRARNTNGAADVERMKSGGNGTVMHDGVADPAHVSVGRRGVAAKGLRWTTSTKWTMGLLTHGAGGVVQAHGGVLLSATDLR